MEGFKLLEELNSTLTRSKMLTEKYNLDCNHKYSNILGIIWAINLCHIIIDPGVLICLGRTVHPIESAAHFLLIFQLSCHKNSEVESPN